MNEGPILNYNKWKILESEESPETWLDYKFFYKHLQAGGLGIIYWNQPGCSWCIKLKEEVFDKQAFTDWCKKTNIKCLDLKPGDPDPKNLKTKLGTPLEGTPDVRIIRLPKTDSFEPISREIKTGYQAGGADQWIRSIDLSKL
jgi:hypothetical protein